MESRYTEANDWHKEGIKMTEMFDTDLMRAIRETLYPNRKKGQGVTKKETGLSPSTAKRRLEQMGLTPVRMRDFDGVIRDVWLREAVSVDNE